MRKPKANISSAFGGKERYLTDSFIRAFCKAFDVINPDWLITGEGEMLIGIKPVISYTQGKPYYNVDFIGGFDILFLFKFYIF